MNVIGSNKIEHDVTQKPVPTFGIMLQGLTTSRPGMRFAGRGAIIRACRADPMRGTAPTRMP